MIDLQKIKTLQQWLSKPTRIVAVSHANPDGDAIGSGLAWTTILQKLGHDVHFIVPNPYPGFLMWMAEINKVHVYKTDPEACEQWIEQADLIFCMDFNQINRLEKLGDEIQKNEKAKRILVDHHLDPPTTYDLIFSDTSASSTALIAWQLIEALGWKNEVDYPAAEALYVGISTDTGNFSFGNLTPELFRVMAQLVEKGVNPPKLNIAIYDNYSVERMKLMGYMLNNKMKVIPEKNAAYMSLDKFVQRRYDFQPGDSEGFVNMPLSIKNIKLSAFFLETRECIKVSLRSQGDIDVNQMARKYYNGGGHKNAAGGKHFGSIREAENIFKKAVNDCLNDS